MRKFLKDEKGTALIQTAIILPVILGLFMGGLLFCNAYKYKNAINTAAAVGAKTYQINKDEGKAIAKAQSQLAMLGVQKASCKIEGDGNFVITKPYGFYIPVFGKHLLNIKSEYKAHAEINPRYYGKSWSP